MSEPSARQRQGEESGEKKKKKVSVVCLFVLAEALDLELIMTSSHLISNIIWIPEGHFKPMHQKTSFDLYSYLR